MTSIMQSPGRVRKGKVEIFLTKKVSIECKPMCCQWCGEKYIIGVICQGCKRAITHLFWRRDPATPAKRVLGIGEADETTALFTQWDDAAKAIASSNDNMTCYCANTWTDQDYELDTLTRPDGTKQDQPRLYRIWRKPVGMLGCWVQFRWCNELHAPDLSTPTRVYQHKFPKDAKPLTIEEAQAYWFTPRSY